MSEISKFELSHADLCAVTDRQEQSIAKLEAENSDLERKLHAEQERYRSRLAAYDRVNVELKQAQLDAKGIRELWQSAEAENAELRNNRDRLAKFFLWVMAATFEGCDTDGGEAQDKAVELGLAHYEPYDLEKHESLGSFEGDSGDPICILDVKDTAQ